MAYAVFDEIYQTFIPGRGAEAAVADLFRDGIGIILGIGLYSVGMIVGRYIDVRAIINIMNSKKKSGTELVA